MKPDPAVTLPPLATGRRLPMALSAVAVVVSVGLLLAMGRRWWCACGHWWPAVWDVNTEHNSQHLLDPYFLSHVVHGLLFFAFFWVFSDRFGLAWRFLMALVVELAWEVLENSPLVIDRYRQTTVSLGYVGDSIVNSLGDTAGFAVGFFVARQVGRWPGVAVVVGSELLMLLWIRDNLTLNVLMLVWPVEAVRRWQAGG